MRKKILFILTFIIGLSLGALGHYEMTRPSERPTEAEVKLEDNWRATYTEEKTHERMLQFQDALEAMRRDSTAKDADTLSKEIEAQLWIEDLMVKYRESQHAKYAWLVDSVGVIGAALLSAIVTLLLATRGRSGKWSHD